MNKRILKWDIPVDGATHPIGRGPVVHVDCQHDDPAKVQVWTEEIVSPQHPMDHLPRATVVATGQPIPIHARHLGTALVKQGRIVWHVVMV